MGEELDNVANVTVNFDIDSLNNKLDEIKKTLSNDSKAIIRDCAITLYTNTNFDNNTLSPIVIAKKCVERALIMANELKNQNLLPE
jgi:hypothetical protein